MSERKQFRWYKRPSGIWGLNEIGQPEILGDIAEVRYTGIRGRWRATVLWPKNWWSMCGSTKQGRALVEQFLSHKCWEWDDCELVP